MLIRNASLADCEKLASSLREADLREINTLHPDACPKAILAQSLGMSSYAFTATADEGVVCIGGVAPRGDGSGSVWLVGSRLMTGHRIALGRMSPACIDLMHHDYRLIHNIVDSRNTLHLNWLRWCGFKQMETRLINGVEFIAHYHLKDTHGLRQGRRGEIPVHV